MIKFAASENINENESVRVRETGWSMRDTEQEGSEPKGRKQQKSEIRGGKGEN